MIQPTVNERNQTLDVIRGVAILGILLANMVAFGSPALATMMGGAMEFANDRERWVTGATLAFVNGKFRSMLAILFGIGLYLQYRKRIQQPGAWPGGYLKRTFFLAVIGVFHAVVIWFGDILFLYSAVAFVACWLVHLDAKVLRLIITIGAAFAVLCGGCLMGAFMLMGTSGDSSTFEMFPFMSAQNEQQVYDAGNFFQQVLFRGKVFGIGLFNVIFFVPLILPLFLLGILMARSGALTAPSQHRSTRNAALWVGIGLGLPINLVALYVVHSGMPLTGIQILFELVLGPILGIGYLMLLAIWSERGGLKGLQNMLAKIGRVALSCYLLQSLVCTFIFYSWGLGLYGKLDRFEMLAVVPIVWLINALFAHFWLKHYSIGPVEWLWRSLTEGRKLPWRYEPARMESAPRFDI